MQGEIGAEELHVESLLEIVFPAVSYELLIVSELRVREEELIVDAFVDRLILVCVLS